MKRISLASVLSIVGFIFVLPGSATADGLTPELVNRAEFGASGSATAKNGNEPARDPALLKAQILLDRAHFSPGVVDGWPGDNTVNAIKAFEAEQGLKVDGKLDDAVWNKLSLKDTEPVLVTYTIVDADVAGPFLAEDPKPGDFAAMSKLDSLAYNGPVELLAEKFHMDQDLLQALNPEADFTVAGTEVVVADTGSDEGHADVSRIEVNKAGEIVNVFDADGNLVAAYPATIGSSEYPELDGKHSVRAIAISPIYYFDPSTLKTLSVNLDTRAEIAAGPNNPVGNVWIDLSKDTFGIHGTPDPEKVGKENSHGCVRLTNWDALELARMVSNGTEVEFVN